MVCNKYSTTYRIQGVLYGFHIWASSYEEAVKIAAQRNISEQVGDVIISESETSDTNEGSLTDQLHESVILSWIALKGGLMDVDELLSDAGVTHLIAHRLCGIDADDFIFEGSVPILLNKLRDAIPGYRKPVGVDEYDANGSV